LVYSHKGECVARYDKAHLFNSVVSKAEAYRELKTTIAGNQIVCVDTPASRIGLSICYDLRFPDFYQKLRELGADIIVVPSAFTVTTGNAHWETLLRARAIENQVYIVAAAQVGQHPGGRLTYGHTLSVNGWGTVTDTISNKVGLITQESISTS
jgi:predicted amidohydrolase